ncbi:eCIS core domain-containing protein [Nostoc sp.]|uniref:eCIS core domain-containing protein n=1 Tax=Nostoc sp. TaxID=1180 RepID=UPI002FFAD741
MKSLKSPSSSFSNSQAPEQTPQLAYRPFGGQTQKASFTPVTQTDVENEAFVEEKMEVTGLELQAKHRTITPEGQERLTVLQAKMDRSLNSRLEKATRFGHNFANIPVRRPDTSTPIQAKLTIGEPGDKYEQEADQTARQVMQRIHQPENGKLQREELPDNEDELQAKPEGSIQREELLEEEVQMKSWGETPSLQREELPEEELQMKPLGTLSQIVNEVKSPTKPLGHDISRISLRRPQTKLTVNQPGDIYEQEADSVAQLVMQRMSVGREALPEEEDQLQMKSLADSVTPLVQRQGGGRTAATSELETSIQQARGNGQPLADDIKQPMEQAFGADFGGVKIHTDSRSDQLNQSVQARAFTTGQDIFFRQGEYSPGSHGGKELLAHELTHVVQQNGSAVGRKSIPDQGVKENKIQAKALITSPSIEQPIQRRENPQQQPERENQGQPDQASLKADVQNQEGQRQALADRQGVAAASPPADGGGTANPPPAQGGNPSLGGNKAGQESASVNQQAVPISAEDPGQILEQLKNTPPTQAFATYTQAETASAQALDNQRQQLQATIPEIPAPTGLSPQKADAVPKNSAPATPQLGEPASAQGQANPVAGSVGGLSGAIASSKSSQNPEQSSENPDINAISTNAGDRPKVDMTGEADPSQMHGEQGQSLQQVQAAKGKAASTISQDFGENNIFPKASNQTLKANKELSKVSPSSGKGGEIPTISPEIVGGLNQGLTPYYQAKIAPEQQKYLTGKQQFEADSGNARQDSNQKITNFNEEAKQKQLEQQKQSQQEVAQARQDWKSELDNTEKDYQDKAGKATKEQQQKIDEEKRKGEQDADKKLTDAEQEAADQKKKAEEDAAKEKEKEKGERKSGWDKFWGGVKDIGSAIVEGIKKAVNAIYDGLRKAVKAIFDAVKTVVTAIIDAVRTVIVGLIKAFGEILKGLVQIVFAAFPEISKKFTNAIDQAVNKATEVVNAAADFLKTAVSGILDFLAKTLDTLLGLVQSIYNGALTVIGMLIRGEFAELAKRFSNLIEGAKAMPPQFEIAGLEELMGGGELDLDKPLAPEELAQAQQAGVSIPSMGGENTPGTGEASEMPSAPWSEENVGVDAVEDNMELSPELTEELMQQSNGEGEVMLAESQEESRSMDAIISEATGEQQVGGEQEQQEIPDDGLSPKQRASIKWELMKQGIKQWFSDNWPKLLAGLIAATVVIIGAIVASGGAILAALPILMDILTVVFAADTIAKIGGYMRDYLSKSWEGDIQGGGKSLAKALAAGAIEIIMLLTFEAGKLATKGAKAVAKGAKAVAKGTANLAKKAFRGVIKGIKYVIEKGKVLFKGIAGTGVGKQFKRLEDLGKGLLERMRFKAFRVRVANGWFRLEGLINPWALIAEGKIKITENEGEGTFKVTQEQSELLEKVNNRIKQQNSNLRNPKSPKFELTYNTKELQEIFEKGKSLELTDKEITDLIYIGSRKNKSINAEELKEQMDFWSKVKKGEQVPGRFKNLDDFNKFKTDMKDNLGKKGFPNDDIRIQGSSLRKPFDPSKPTQGPQDVDIAVFVDEKKFNEILNDIKSKNLKERSPQLERQFKSTERGGMIQSKDPFLTDEMKEVLSTLKDKYEHLNIESISIMRQGSRYDLEPSLKL